MNRRMLHTQLIRINGIREKLQHELKEFEDMRKTVHDKQRGKLEYRIETRKSMIKDLDLIEQDIRLEL